MLQFCSPIKEALTFNCKRKGARTRGTNCCLPTAPPAQKGVIKKQLKKVCRKQVCSTILILMHACYATVCSRRWTKRSADEEDTHIVGVIDTLKSNLGFVACS